VGVGCEGEGQRRGWEERRRVEWRFVHARREQRR